MNTTVENTVDQVEGDRGLPSVNERKPTSVKKGLAVLFVAAVLLLGAGLLYFWLIRGSRADANKPVPQSEQLANNAPAQKFELPPPPAPEQPQDEVQPIGLADPAAGQTVPAPAPGGTAPVAAPPPRPRLDKGSASLMVSGGTTAGGVAPAAAGAPGGAAVGPYANVGFPSAENAPAPAGSGGGGGPLAGLLTGTNTAMSSADKLGDRNMTLAKGSFIDCVLQTRIDSTLPGMTACVVTRNIFSDNGKVLLIERGSVVTGEYQSALQEGQNRLFVLWTRVKTPNGVVINIDSPATDPLGGAGVGGKVNYHFWKRFGAAMFLSMIDDGFAALANRQNEGSTYNYGNTSNAVSDMASKTLEKTINIAPTLYKNQGERINIFVARDLNFGAVYALRPR